MPKTEATLHMLCGRICAGKSTLARRLAEGPGVVVLSEDHFLARLYPGEIETLGDYVRCAERLREAVGPHVRDLLRAGVSVVLDFQANTPGARAWMRGLFERAGARHQLHVLLTPQEVCLARLAERNAAGEHEYQVSEEDFELFTSYFTAPAEEVDFEVVLHEGQLAAVA